MVWEKQDDELGRARGGGTRGSRCASAGSRGDDDVSTFAAAVAVLLLSFAKTCCIGLSTSRALGGFAVAHPSLSMDTATALEWEAEEDQKERREGGGGNDRGRGTGGPLDERRRTDGVKGVTWLRSRELDRHLVRQVPAT